MLPDPQAIVLHLRQLQRLIRGTLIASRQKPGAADVARDSAGDTIYGLDALVEPILVEFFQEWAKESPMVVVAEGLEPATGRVFPDGIRQEDAVVRLILDPIDGTRGLMYDKRSAWSLAGAAPNKGPNTRLRDIEVAVMTELPTAKQGLADVLWAIRGQGAQGAREDLSQPRHPSQPLRLIPSRAGNIDHGFAMVSNFFPGTKVMASELMEHLASELIGTADVTRASVFDDQYISTGGQFYELIVGHDRFNADLRPAFYRIQRQPEGLCCHPYDCATALIAEEAGVILTDDQGRPLDGPMDVTTGLNWIGYANESLRQRMERLVRTFLNTRQ